MTNIPRLNEKNVCFVFIDLQEKLLARIPNADRVISRNTLLVEAANLLGLPYMSTSQYRKGLGEVVSPVMEKIRKPVLDKTSFSCAADENISKEFGAMVREVVVLSGVETHICVLQTCLDLLGKGRQVAIVADAVGARTQTDHDLGLKRMERSGAMLVTAEMVIYEVIGRSDSPEFKKLLPFIKGI